MSADNFAKMMLEHRCKQRGNTSASASHTASAFEQKMRDAVGAVEPDGRATACEAESRKAAAKFQVALSGLRA